MNTSPHSMQMSSAKEKEEWTKNESDVPEENGFKKIDITRLSSSMNTTSFLLLYL